LEVHQQSLSISDNRALTLFAALFHKILSKITNKAELLKLGYFNKINVWAVEQFFLNVCIPSLFKHSMKHWSCRQLPAEQLGKIWCKNTDAFLSCFYVWIFYLASACVIGCCRSRMS